MSLVRIAWRNLSNRKLQTSITILVIALGIAMTLSVMMISTGIKSGIAEASKPYGMLVGSKGSANQLVFNTIYLMDTPLANLPFSYVEQLQDDERVQLAVPFGLGDNYRGYRIVGTTEQFFGLRSSPTEEPYFQLSDGRLFEAPFEAVVGQKVVNATGLAIGDTFTSGHGVVQAIEEDHSHADYPYTVVGIMQDRGVPADLGIYVPIESYWISHGQHLHEEESGHVVSEGYDEEQGHSVSEGYDDEEQGHSVSEGYMDRSVEEEHAHTATEGLNHMDGDEHGRVAHTATEGHDLSTEDQHGHATSDEHGHATSDEHAHDLAEEPGVTSLLVQPDSYMQLMQLYAEINNGAVAQAVFPGQVLAKVFDMMGSGEQVWTYISYMVLGMTVLTILLFLYNSTLEKRRSMAIMRAIGAGRWRIFSIVILESIWVVALGSFVGVGLTYVITTIASSLINQFSTLSILLTFSWDYIAIIGIVWAIGIVAAVLPAITAYRTEVARHIHAS